MEHLNKIFTFVSDLCQMIDKKNNRYILSVNQNLS